MTEKDKKRKQFFSTESVLSAVTGRVCTVGEHELNRAEIERVEDCVLDLGINEYDFQRTRVRDSVGKQLPWVFEFCCKVTKENCEKLTEEFIERYGNVVALELSHD